MLEVNTNFKKEKLEQQREALMWQLTQDIPDKDREIHTKALEDINKALSRIPDVQMKKAKCYMKGGDNR